MHARFPHKRPAARGRCSYDAGYLPGLGPALLLAGPGPSACQWGWPSQQETWGMIGPPGANEDDPGAEAVARNVAVWTGVRGRLCSYAPIGSIGDSNAGFRKTEREQRGLLGP